MDIDREHKPSWVLGRCIPIPHDDPAADLADESMYPQIQVVGPLRGNGPHYLSIESLEEGCWKVPIPKGVADSSCSLQSFQIPSIAEKGD